MALLKECETLVEAPDHKHCTPIGVQDEVSFIETIHELDKSNDDFTSTLLYCARHVDTLHKCRLSVYMC